MRELKFRRCTNDAGEEIYLRYIGLKDKNGTGIYERDIVRKSGHMCVVTQLVIAKWLIEEDRMNSSMSCAEVIGNIYENPELMEDFNGGK